jgi:sec-independent protein translocase protein TatA
VTAGKEETMTENMLAIGGLGTPEIVVIAIVIFLLFGATRLPQLAKALGQSKRAFKEGLDDGDKDGRKDLKE